MRYPAPAAKVTVAPTHAAVLKRSKSPTPSSLIGLPTLVAEKEVFFVLSPPCVLNDSLAFASQRARRTGSVAPYWVSVLT